MFFPIQGDTAYASTALLLLMDGENNSITFPDQSITPKTVTRSGGAVINTTVLGYPAAQLLNATNDYLNITSHADFALGTGDYTVEWFAYVTSLLWGCFFDFRPNSGNGAYPNVYSDSNGNLKFYWNGDDRITSGNGVIALNTLYHLALCRSGSSTRLFVNGIQVGSTYINTDSIPQSRILVGASGYLLANQFDGYIPGFRVVRQALYTANFTPPNVKSFLAYGDNKQFHQTPRFQPSAHHIAYRGL